MFTPVLSCVILQPSIISIQATDAQYVIDSCAEHGKLEAVMLELCPRRWRGLQYHERLQMQESSGRSRGGTSQASTGEIHESQGQGLVLSPAYGLGMLLLLRVLQAPSR